MKGWPLVALLTAQVVGGIMIGHGCKSSPVAALPVPAAEPIPTVCHDAVTSLYVLDQTNTQLRCAVGARVIVDANAGAVTCECPDPAPSTTAVSWEVRP